MTAKNKTKFRIVFLLFLFAAFLVFSCSKENEEDLFDDKDCVTQNQSYTADIAPILAGSCNSCHGTSAPTAGIITASYEGLKNIAGNGSLLGSINHASGYSPMPKGGSKLPECARLKIAAWIAAGATNN